MTNPSRFNLSGVNYERNARQPRKPGFWGRLAAIVLTLAAILIVVWLLFNPVRTRPTAAAYIQNFNRIAAAQNLPDRLDPTLPDPAAGFRDYALDQAGLVLRISSDSRGYVTALSLSGRAPDGPAPGENAGDWRQLTPGQLRNRFLLMLDALDPKWTVVSLYRTFSAMGIELDQPLAEQPAGTRELTAEALHLRLTHDNRLFQFQARLDILPE